MGFECRKGQEMILKSSRRDLFFGSEAGRWELCHLCGSVPGGPKLLKGCRRTSKRRSWRGADTLRAGLAATVADPAIGGSV